MKKVLLTILSLCFTLVASAQYHLEWDEHVYLPIPDPPFNGYVARATWNVNNSNLSFDEADEAGAIIYPNHYFEGASIVTCNYRYEYYRNGSYQTGTSVASYTITFNSKEAALDKSEISLSVGQTATIKASFPGVSYIHGNPEMTWSTSDKYTVSITRTTESPNWTAKIKAVASGSATITFDPIIGPPKTCHINVAYIAPTSAKLTPNPLTVTAGKTKKFDISYSPDGATAKSVTWGSSNENIATVTSTGIVTGISAGKAVITATTDNGIQTKADVIVQPAPSSVSIPSTLLLYVGYTRTLTPSILPENSETSYTWASSDTSIITVSSGKITGKKAGTATITVTTDNGKTANCEVTVQKTPIDLNVQNANNRLTVIETLVNRIIKKD